MGQRLVLDRGSASDMDAVTLKVKHRIGCLKCHLRSCPRILAVLSI